MLMHLLRKLLVLKNKTKLFFVTHAQIRCPLIFSSKMSLMSLMSI